MKVKLYAPTVGVMEFDKAHAERILKKENNGGWVEYKAPEKIVEQVKLKTSGVKRDKRNTKKPQE